MRKTSMFSEYEQSPKKQAVVRFIGILALGYALLIVMGSLYPYTGWQPNTKNVFYVIVSSWPKYITRTDVVTNILVYIPLGVLAAWSFRYRFKKLTATICAVAAGFALSLAMENAQLFLPGRISSNLDLLTNTLGALVGALLVAFVVRYRRVAKHLIYFRQLYFLPGYWINAGLAILALGFLSLLLPGIPSFNTVMTFDNQWRLWPTLLESALFKPQLSVLYSLNIIGLGLFASFLIMPGKKLIPLLVGLMGVTFVIKYLLIEYVLKTHSGVDLISIEALFGFILGISVLAMLTSMPRNGRNFLAIVTILGAFMVAQMNANAGSLSIVLAFNDLRLPRQMLNLTGFGPMLSFAWPFLALFYLAIFVYTFKEVMQLPATFYSAFRGNERNRIKPRPPHQD